ncbi:kinesin [Trypanosoma grayi]|uniref:kinesin n=1 Tax=Trypanosoma grayi TaxID=71804 RepID=UPI0004F40B9A|nr:kinesin [Trypanosoma grayi]KEG13042.1 kinesin [Trypanosoma grayi]
MGDEENKGDGPNRIMVFLRIRPARKDEIDPASGTHYLLDIQPDNKTCILEAKTYSYDYVFNGDVDQGDIYVRVAEPVINNVFKGYWGTVMVYGQTGTGKSFTMCNFSPAHLGIIPRSMKAIFDTVQNDPERIYTIVFSFIQIYVDKLQDLFNPEAPELKINRDKNGVSFPGIVEHAVKDEEDFRRLYEDGNQYRVVTATKMNPESSRGHAALFIQVRSVPKDDPGGEVRNGKLFLIDLAGYERFSKTGVQEGQMALEAKTINASLLSLGNVVQALSDRSEHVPWRNAKLTRMLEDAIGGRAKCSIILTAGPSSEHLYETLGTLYFGSRAMAVKTNAKLAVNIDYKKLAAKLQELLAAAEGRINTLEVEATQRQLEREEAEAAFQAEWARIKRLQQDQLNELLASGASKEKIEELIRSNEEENRLMEEQQYQQRQALEERHEQELKESLEREQKMMMNENAVSTSNMNKDMGELQRQLAQERIEKEKYRSKAKEAESEARRVSMEMNELRVQLEGEGLAALSGSPTNPEFKKEFERRIEIVRSMYEENMQLRISEMEELHNDEINRYKTMYEDVKRRMEREIQSHKDTLVASYEEEIDNIRKTSADVQNKLKKNHLVIKQSYQAQKETVEQENKELTAYIEMLTKQVQSLGARPAPRPSNGVKSGSAMIPGDANKRIQDMMATIKELRAELAYVRTEKDALSKEKESEEAKGDRRLNPAQILQLKNENDELKQAKKQLEGEVFKMKAELALASHQVEEDDDEDDKVIDVFGDSEGISAFIKAALKIPYYPGTQAIQSMHKVILGSLTTDLDEYRRMLKYRFFVIGAPNGGKSSVVKCLSASSTPMIRSTPDVLTPTVHPTLSSVTVDDAYCLRNDWYKTYVQFLDLDAPQQQHSGGFFSSIGISKSSRSGVSDPAKIHIDLLDFPSDTAFWRGMPPYLLPSKNVVYCLVYDLTKPIEDVKQELEKQLTLLHAACHRAYSKDIGGDAAKIGFCLIGTRKDALKDSRESTVLIHINRVAVLLGDTFFRLRGDDNRGLVCVGNFAVSAKDWSVVSTKKDQGPKTFKDLNNYLGTIATQLYSNRPSSFLPSTKDTASHLSYMLGDEMLESSAEKTSHLVQAHQRMRQGIVTLVTALYREQKVRWGFQEKELRRLISEHLSLDSATSYGIFCENYVVRELFSRGVVVALPSAIIEPKYLPRVGGSKPLPHNGVIVLDFFRLLTNFSTFICPSSLTKIPNGSSFLKDREVMLFDYSGLSRCQTTWGQGILTADVTQVVGTKLLPQLGNDVRTMQELYCVMGLGLSLKAEVAMISPPHFSARISDCLSYYLSYMISCNGDGVARQYKFNALPSALFACIQARLIPFSHVPSKDPRHLLMNWKDASFLVLEKTRLKYGIFGSKVVKDAASQTNIPLRGIMKHEGQCLYIGITGRHADSNEAFAACNEVLEAIHYEITSTCKRYFRGAKVQYQDLALTGASIKRESFATGQQTILSRYKADPAVIMAQQKIASSLSDPKAREIEEALINLPLRLREK